MNIAMQASASPKNRYPDGDLHHGTWYAGLYRKLDDRAIHCKKGHRYPERSAVCFETQHYPDSINKPGYPSVVLRAGERFQSRTTYKFST